ncbi:superoxide dismutase family protein [Novosphingobium sp.]|uniref:superoxide dismutase family protein n=1 Tax=Novosphingobium sp. TaxID=1874826 RepID=UPI0038BC27A0
MVTHLNTSKWLLLVGTVLVTGACATAGIAPSTIGHAQLVTPDGRAVGEAVLHDTKGQVSVTITAHDIAAGPHGLHLHAVGKCEGPAFASAGPHLNPGNHQHGSLNPAGTHLGDLPNLVIAADGKGSVTFSLPGNESDTTAALFDADGSAIVVHATQDDYLTDPSGNSGARIACGTVMPG